LRQGMQREGLEDLPILPCLEEGLHCCLSQPPAKPNYPETARTNSGALGVGKDSRRFLGAARVRDRVREKAPARAPGGEEVNRAGARAASGVAVRETICISEEAPAYFCCAGEDRTRKSRSTLRGPGLRGGRCGAHGTELSLGDAGGHCGAAWSPGRTWSW
jgi:hypothetical protein